MSTVTYRNISYDPKALSNAKRSGQVTLTYRGITYVKEVN